MMQPAVAAATAATAAGEDEALDVKSQGASAVAAAAQIKSLLAQCASEPGEG
jgi:hypothetical protein